MRICRKKQAVQPIQVKNPNHEDRLIAAEKRANVLLETTQWISTVVTRRDQENHWQASVNQMFLGGQP